MLHLIRKYYLKKKIKKNNNISFIVVDTHRISGVEKLSIGEGCRLSPGMTINANGGVCIGANVIFAPNCVIWSQNHNFRHATLLPYDKKIINKAVTIGNNCWFGEGVKIAPGVEIGEGCIVAMGAVVLNDIPAYSIVMGNPAIAVKQRTDLDTYKTLDIQEHSYIRHKLKAYK